MGVEHNDVDHDLKWYIVGSFQNDNFAGKDVDEGLGSKLAGLGLAGAMALGSAGANARVTPDGQGGFTGGLKPSTTVTAPADNKPAAEAPKGFSKEYLQKAADPNRFGRYMISVEKAQELLKNMQEAVAEGSQRVDSLVTDALKIMQGSDVNDAVRALKTVLGDREYNGRRGHYNFYVRQLMDMYGQQGVTEAGYRNYDDNRTGFGKNSQAYRADGGANDEDHESDRRREQQVQSGTWYIRLNGKIIKDKQGNPYSFRGKAAANKAALTMQAKLFNQGKEFMLTTNPNDNPQGVAEGWKDVVAGSAMALSSLGVGAQTMPSMNGQQVELANKYFQVLVQRAKEDGRELDTRTLNVLKAKAQDAAAQKMQQSKKSQTNFPSQGSERRVSKDIGTFESQGVAEGPAVDAYMAGKSPALAHFADQLDKSTEVNFQKNKGVAEGQRSGYGRGYASYKSSK
jgi:hypothetical protein